MVRHLHLSGIMIRLVVKNGRQKDTCHDEIGLCGMMTSYNFSVHLRFFGSI